MSTPRDPPRPAPLATRMLAALQREPVLFVTVGYVAVSAIGLWTNYWFFRRFQLPILQYMQGSDFLVAGLREPTYALLLLLALLIAWALTWPERWQRRHPERSQALRSTWWGRVVFSAPSPYWSWSWWGVSPETGTAIGAVWIMLCALTGVTVARADGIYRGKGQAVRVTLAGRDAPLPGDARLLGTTAGFVMLWWPDAKRVEAIANDDLGRIQSLPRGTPRAGQPVAPVRGAGAQRAAAPAKAP